jgi:23S rRNA (cytidine1920-2'-O)/16S rRNA (cytidine1409-2'-O)-methyltransferase
MMGKVLVNGRKVEKPGTPIDIESDIQIVGSDQPFVSRGGQKLERALSNFKVAVTNRIAMDVGASTGGFTDCLLQHGATFVFAVDSGYNQLSWKLINDRRVKSLEKTNFRYLTLGSIGTFVDTIVVDVSFISLKKILPNCFPFLKKSGELIALVKPQFEAGREHIKKGGIVSEPSVRQHVIQSIIDFAKEIGFDYRDYCLSPIQGKKSGNTEFLIHLLKPA